MYRFEGSHCLLLTSRTIHGKIAPSMGTSSTEGKPVSLLRYCVTALSILTFLGGGLRVEPCNADSVPGGARTRSDLPPEGTLPGTPSVRTESLWGGNLLGVNREDFCSCADVKALFCACQWGPCTIFPQLTKPPQRQSFHDQTSNRAPFLFPLKKKKQRDRERQHDSIPPVVLLYTEGTLLYIT